MFFGLCIHDVIDETGLLDSFIARPIKDGVFITDFLKDVGPRLDGEIDFGPIRIYIDKSGLRFNNVRSRLSHERFAKHGDGIKCIIEHLNLPLKQAHAGYYSLLLPSGYSGKVKTDNGTPTIYYIEDTRQMLVLSVAEPYSPNVRISCDLKPYKSPTKNAEVISSLSDMFNNDSPSLYDTSISSLLLAIRSQRSQAKVSAFLCHSSSDKPVVRRLAIGLKQRGIHCWIDEAEIKIGDSLIAKLEDGIYSSTCLVPILSKESIKSKWCKEELRMALTRQINTSRKQVLPVLLENCKLPGFLLDKVYADLRNLDAYDEVVDKLSMAIRSLVKE